ncbi:MAG: metal-dependent transcriptional regulator [Candidatus Pacebacteria bacterium]|nr:metal-dependent transcriptional regulator [Candidatus Paceibacterota bacterium]
MSNVAALSAQLEDYLESIARLCRESGEAHVQEIADRLSVHKSTVTAALRSLAEKGLIHYRAYRPATLTVTGRKGAKEGVRRHEVIRQFLTDVLVLDAETAERNACELEHAIEKKVLDRLMAYADFVQNCPRGGAKWIHGFEHYCREGRDSDRCERCVELCLEDLRRTRRVSNATKQGESRMQTLDQLKPGDRARIARIERKGAVSRRLLDMGIVRGTPVEVVKVAPLGDPVEVKIKGYSLSLRKAEAAAVTVEISDEETS